MTEQERLEALKTIRVDLSQYTLWLERNKARLLQLNVGLEGPTRINHAILSIEAAIEELQKAIVGGEK